MDDATINAAIAKRLGWKEDWSDGTFWGWEHLPTSRVHQSSPPDFATSLDAMAEAEATYTPDELSRAIWEIAKERAKEPSIGLEWWLRIPARTRALAFLAATQNRVTATKEQTQ